LWWNLSDYWLGVFFAILSGISNNIGTILQKKVVNRVSNEEKFMRSLIKNPLWLLGLIFQMVIGVILFLLAQNYIGPTLIPGLMASGLIVLAIGSVYILKEHLGVTEIFGIGLMIIATCLIGLSNMDINVDLINFLDLGLIIRISIFTAIFLFLSIIFEILQKKEKYPGISAALISGLMLALSNFWISPLLGVIIQVLNNNALLIELVIFVIACIILIFTNIFALAKINQAFKFGQASNMIVIQQFPILISPPFYYLSVYLLIPPNILSTPLMLFGTIFVIISTYLLAKRQAQIEKIK